MFLEQRYLNNNLVLFWPLITKIPMTSPLTLCWPTQVGECECDIDRWQTYFYYCHLFLSWQTCIWCVNVCCNYSICNLVSLLLCQEDPWEGGWGFVEACYVKTWDCQLFRVCQHKLSNFSLLREGALTKFRLTILIDFFIKLALFLCIIKGILESIAPLLFYANFQCILVKTIQTSKIQSESKEGKGQ